MAPPVRFDADCVAAVRQAAADMVPHLLDDYCMNRDEATKFRNALTPPLPALWNCGSQPRC